MTSRRSKSAACLLAICLPVCLTHAQTNTPPALKFDEFGDVYPTDAAARLDNFANELMSKPNTRGFIIVYRSQRDCPA